MKSSEPETLTSVQPSTDTAVLPRACVNPPLFPLFPRLRAAPSPIRDPLEQRIPGFV